MLRSNIAALVRPKLEALGARYVVGLEALAAGEATGVFTMGSRWDSLDTAIAGLNSFYADPEVVAAMAESPVQIVGRSIGVVEAEVGDTQGAYAGIGIAVAQSPTPEGVSAVTETMCQIVTDAGCNGVRNIRTVAAGDQTGTYSALVYTDSLDAYAAGLAALWEDDTIAGLFADMGVQPVGRVITRCH